MPRARVRFDAATAKVMTRQEAINAHLVRYFTGKPCNRGHLTYRYSSTGACHECLHPPAKWFQRGDEGVQYNVGFKIVAPMGGAEDWARLEADLQSYAALWCEHARVEQELGDAIFTMQRESTRLEEPPDDPDYVKPERRPEVEAKIMDARGRRVHAELRLAALKSVLDAVRKGPKTTLHRAPPPPPPRA